MPNYDTYSQYRIPLSAEESLGMPEAEEALADKEYAKQVMNGIPCGYTGQSQDCAGIVLLLCSEAGRYMTGEDIYIDGGMKL